MKNNTFRPGRTAGQAQRALKSALDQMQRAEHCAVLWFAEINRRQLYKKLGYASMNQYARQELQFSKTRTGDYLQLTRRLGQLKPLKTALEKNTIGYTKAREIIKVATADTVDAWLDQAQRSTRRELEEQVKRHRQLARTARTSLGDGLFPACPNQAESTLAPERPASFETPSPGHEGLAPSESSGKGQDQPAPANPNETTPAPADIPRATPIALEIPERVAFTFSPEQFARYESLLEKLAKLNDVDAKDRTELLLAGLTALLEKAPRGDQDAGASPFVIHIHQCPDCEEAEISTGRGSRTLSPTTLERARCDSRVDLPGLPNRQSIPPSRRREVLRRDRHRCRISSCRHTRFLEVHHLTPRADGGTNEADNLITLCSTHHRLLHENRWNLSSSGGYSIIREKEGRDSPPRPKIHHGLFVGQTLALSRAAKILSGMRFRAATSSAAPSSTASRGMP